MKKVFQTIYGLMRKSQKNISKSLGEKESDKAADEFIQRSNEIKEEIQQKVTRASEELAHKIEAASKSAKENLQKKRSSKTGKKTSTSKKKDTKKTSKTAAKKKTTTKKASSKTDNKVTKKTTKAPAKKSTVKTKSNTTKKATKVAPKKKAVTKKSNVSYPKGSIVNSKVLSSVEKGYLELAGFRNYKDAFENLNTSSKRSKVAKEVTTTATVLTNALKKLELIPINGLAEQSVELLCELNVNSLQKLQKADSKKLYVKIKKLKESNKKFKANISEKQLEKYIKEAKSMKSLF